MKEPLPPGPGSSEEHSLCQSLHEAATEDQRQPTLHSTALTPSSLLSCLHWVNQPETTGQGSPGGAENGSVGTGGQVEKNTHLGEGGSKKRQGDSEEMAAGAVGYFLGKEEEG